MIVVVVGFVSIKLINENPWKINKITISILYYIILYYIYVCVHGSVISLYDIPTLQKPTLTNLIETQTPFSI